MYVTFLGSSKWPKSSHEGSLLQPRLIDGNTGATPLLPRRWSGSESSINSELGGKVHTFSEATKICRNLHISFEKT